MPQPIPANQQQVKSAQAQSVAHPGSLPQSSQLSHHPTSAPQSALSQSTVQRALANPRALAPNDILQLQRTAGNQAVQRMLQQERQAGIQADSSVNNATTAQRKGLQAPYVSKE